MRTAVRQLLEATACVSRECLLIKRNHEIRRARKRLLSDWYRLGADANQDTLLVVANSAWRFLAVWRPFVTSIQHATKELFKQIAYYLLHSNVDFQRVAALIQVIMGEDHLLFSMDEVLKEVVEIQQYLDKMLPLDTHQWQKPSPFESGNLLLNFRDWTTDNGLLQELLHCYLQNKDKQEKHSVLRLIQLWLQSYWLDTNHTLNDILLFWCDHLADSEMYDMLFPEVVQLFAGGARTRQLKVQYIGLPDHELETSKPVTDYTTLFEEYKTDRIDENYELSHTSDLETLLLQWKQGEKPEGETFDLDIPPWTLAKTLTLLESALFLAVETIEFPKYFKHSNTTIDLVFKFSNQLSYYVLETTIQQTHTISYWLHVALSCLYLRNLNSLASIITTLQNHSIERLSFPLDVKLDSLFETLKTIVHPNNNYNVYRSIIQDIAHNGLPCVPFTSLFIRDITFIRDGNETFAKDETGINMNKFHQITKIIAFAQHLQQMQYKTLTCADLNAKNLLVAMTDVNSLYNDNKDRAYQVSIAKVPRLV